MNRITRSARALLIAMVTAAATVATAETELRAQWLNQTCPKGLPKTVEEAPQKLAPVLGAIAAAVVPKLITGGIDIAAKKLQAAGQDRRAALSARSEEEFYEYLRERKNILTVRCLVVVEADYFNAQPPQTGEEAWRAAIPRVGGYSKPRMIFMGAVERSAEGKFFRLIPAYLEIGEWRESSFFQRDRRDYAFSVTMSRIGAQPFGSLDLEFKGVSNNTNYTSTHPLLFNANSNYVPMPELSAEGTKHVNTVERAWAQKDQAAAILDAKATFDKMKQEEAAGTLPPKPPSLFTRTYTASITSYCDAAKTHNKDLPEAQRELPVECRWQLEERRRVVDETKQETQRESRWLDWAAAICWTDPARRAKGLQDGNAKGHKCTEPDSVGEPKKHTIVHSLVVATEVIPGSKTAKFLGDVLAESKADLSKVIVDELPPLTRAARTAADVADRAPWQAITVAELNVTLAQSELNELVADAPLSKITAARIKVQAAWYAANNAYRVVGQIGPYPEGAP